MTNNSPVTGGIGTGDPVKTPKQLTRQQRDKKNPFKPPRTSSTSTSIVTGGIGQEYDYIPVPEDYEIITLDPIDPADTGIKSTLPDGFTVEILPLNQDGRVGTVKMSPDGTATVDIEVHIPDVGGIIAYEVDLGIKQ